jgi:hypothetical protein
MNKSKVFYNKKIIWNIVDCHELSEFPVPVCY